VSDEPTTPPTPPTTPPPASPGAPAERPGDEPPGDEPPEEGSVESPSGGPRRLVIAGVVAAVVFVALVVATRGDDAGAGCLSGLSDHLGPDVEVVGGSDLQRADDAGLDVDSFDGLVDASVEASFQPDPLTSQVVQRLAGDDPEATIGYAPDDLDCWVGNQLDSSFVARGDVDADRVADAEQADDLAVDGNLLAYDGDGDPDRWFEESDEDSPLEDAVRKLDDMGAITFSSLPTGDNRDELLWVGLGLAHDGDDWEFLAVWAFADEELAGSSVDTIVEATEEGEVPSMIEGDVADLIERDGALLTLQAPMRVEAAEWRTPFVQFDPMFGALSDFLADDEGNSDEGNSDEDNSDSGG
jgi:hypothetical protein